MSGSAAPADRSQTRFTITILRMGENRFSSLLSLPRSLSSTIRLPAPWFDHTVIHHWRSRKDSISLSLFYCRAGPSVRKIKNPMLYTVMSYLRAFVCCKVKSFSSQYSQICNTFCMNAISNVLISVAKDPSYKEKYSFSFWLSDPLAGWLPHWHHSLTHWLRSCLSWAFFSTWSFRALAKKAALPTRWLLR